MNRRTLVFASVVGLAVVGVANASGQIAGTTDRERQRRTMATMRRIATANGTMRVDTGRYADSLAELAPTYLQEVPVNDGWGHAFSYVAEEDSYTLTSLGSDGAAGPAPPSVWPDEPFEPDIILRSGQFIQAPTGR